MTATGQDRTPDEQVYQDNKQEPDVKVVYSNDPTDAQVNQQSSDLAAPSDADEASAESFPASDPPATPIALPSKSGAQTDQGSGSA